MKNMFNLAKTISFIFALSLFVFSGQLFAQSLPPSWHPDITFSGDLDIVQGESTQLSAVWTTGSQIDSGPNITRQTWSVNSTPVQQTTIDNNDGTSDYLFDSTFSSVVGDYTVCLRIWHHSQTLRTYQECVVVHVTAPPPPPTDCEGKDAPAIATDHLHNLFPPGDPRRQANSHLIDDVAHEMDEITKAFQGIAKCLEDGSPNPAYAAAVIAFVDSKLTPTELSFWF